MQSPLASRGKFLNYWFHHLFSLSSQKREEVLPSLPVLTCLECDGLSSNKHGFLSRLMLRQSLGRAEYAALCVWRWMEKTGPCWRLTCSIYRRIPPKSWEPKWSYVRGFCPSFRTLSCSCLPTSPLIGKWLQHWRAKRWCYHVKCEKNFFCFCLACAKRILQQFQIARICKPAICLQALAKHTGAPFKTIKMLSSLCSLALNWRGGIPKVPQMQDGCNQWVLESKLREWREDWYSLICLNALRCSLGRFKTSVLIHTIFLSVKVSIQM